MWKDNTMRTLTTLLTIVLFAQGSCLCALEIESTSTVISTNGSDRATRYRNTNKVVTFVDKTHVSWLDWNNESMIATYDHIANTWTQPVEVGIGYDNHGGPALAADSGGYLHMIYGPHNGPFQYAVSAAPNDSSSWVTMPTFAQNATYPSVVIGADDTLHVAYRGDMELIYQKKPAGGAWSQPRVLATAPGAGYAHYHQNLAIAPNGDLHLSYDIYSDINDKAQVAGHMMSTSGGSAWQTITGTAITQPVTPSSAGAFFRTTGYNLGVNNLVVDSKGNPWLTMYEAGPSSTDLYLYNHDGSQWKSVKVKDRLPPEAVGANVDPYSVVGLDTYDRIYVAGLVNGGVSVLSSTFLEDQFELHTVAPAAGGFYPYGVNIERQTGNSDTGTPWIIYSAGHGAVRDVDSDVVAVRLTTSSEPWKPSKTTIFADDFEDELVGSPAPNTPPIGDSWHEYYVGSTMREIAVNPESEARNASSKSLFMSRESGQTSTHSHIQAMISEADQALIEANGNVTIEYKYYDAGVSGTDSWGLSADANIGGPSYHSPRAASMSLRDSGGDYTIRGDGEPYSDLHYALDTWHDFKLDIDLLSHTWTVTLDGVMQSDASGDPAFYNGDPTVSTIDNVLWSPGYYPCHAYIDDVLITTIGGGGPEPFAGDANYDGVVNDSDAAILAMNWQSGPGATWFQGDFNDDGYVNDSDATLLAVNWLKSWPDTLNSVPEPSTIAMMIIGLAIMLGQGLIRGSKMSCLCY